MKRILAAAGTLGLALALSACGTDTTSESESSATTMPSTTMSSTAPETPTPATTTAAEADIVDTAVAAGSFTTLATALTEADLVDTLKGDGPFTVFAPTDEAFDKLPEGTLDELLAEPEGQLTEILTYHVVSGEVMAADVVELDGEKVATVQGGEITVEVVDGKVTLVDATGNRVNVVTTDVEASNGVIHVIDGVLLPAE